MNAQIYEEASEWIVRHRSDTLDADAKQRFDAWLRQSPQHVCAYLEMSSVWESTAELGPNGSADANELIALARADSNVFPLGATAPSSVRGTEAATVHGDSEQSRESDRMRNGRRKNPTLLLSIAAALLVVIGIGGWLYLQRGVYATAIGEQRRIALIDGSSVELNARSKIRIHYTDRERSIDLLQGQALFRVAKDPSRPFIVESNGTRVRAVGTQFDVYKRSTGTVVTVVEGRVAVLTAMPDTQSRDPERTLREPHGSGADSEHTTGADPPSNSARAITSASLDVSDPAAVYLSAGEQLLVTPKIRPLPKVANIEVATAWTQQRLVFDFSALVEVAEEFNRYNQRRLVIDDPGLHRLQISGSFSSTDPTLLLRFLRSQPGITVSETSREIHISRQQAGAE